MNGLGSYMSQSSRSSASSRLTVLLIDDNPADLQSWSNALRVCSPGYSILEASSVERGLALCRTEKVDCVVLDLDFPEASGFQVLCELIPDRERPSIAVVVLTRLVYLALHEMVMHHGAQACLTKHSTSPRMLDKAIQKAVATVTSMR